MATMTEQATLGVKEKECSTPVHNHAHSAAKVVLTEKAASEVKRIIADQHAEGTTDKLYLRLRVVGGGCSGFQHKLDLDPLCNEKLDEVFELSGVEIVVDKRSMLYLDGVTVDYHNDLNKRGFSISNPSAKSTCGCGSSFSM